MRFVFAAYDADSIMAMLVNDKLSRTYYEHEIVRDHLRGILRRMSEHHDVHATEADARAAAAAGQVILSFGAPREAFAASRKGRAHWRSWPVTITRCVAAPESRS